MSILQFGPKGQSHASPGQRPGKPATERKSRPEWAGQPLESNGVSRRFRNNRPPSEAPRATISHCLTEDSVRCQLSVVGLRRNPVGRSRPRLRQSLDQKQRVATHNNGQRTMDHGPPSIDEIFFAAMERESPEARAAYLDLACGSDLDLRRRVERLSGRSAQVRKFPRLARRGADHDAPFRRGAGRSRHGHRPLQADGADRRGGHGRRLRRRADAARAPQGRPEGHQAGDGHQAGRSPASRPSARPWR